MLSSYFTLLLFGRFLHAGSTSALSHNSGKIFTTMTGHTPNEKEKKE